MNSGDIPSTATRVNGNVNEKAVTPSSPQAMPARVIDAERLGAGCGQISLRIDRMPSHRCSSEDTIVVSECEQSVPIRSIGINSGARTGVVTIDTKAVCASRLSPNA